MDSTGEQKSYKIRFQGLKSSFIASNDRYFIVYPINKEYILLTVLI